MPCHLGWHTVILPEHARPCGFSQLTPLDTCQVPWGKPDLRPALWRFPGAHFAAVCVSTVVFLTTQFLTMCVVASAKADMYILGTWPTTPCRVILLLFEVRHGWKTTKAWRNARWGRARHSWYIMCAAQLAEKDNSIHNSEQIKDNLSLLMFLQVSDPLTSPPPSFPVSVPYAWTHSKSACHKLEPLQVVATCGFYVTAMHSLQRKTTQFTTQNKSKTTLVFSCFCRFPLPLLRFQ
jgi:hypothetical protein